MIYNPRALGSRIDLAVSLKCRLLECGFERNTALEKGPLRIREHVYSRLVKPNIYVAVYTSLSEQKGIVSARSTGRGQTPGGCSPRYLPRYARSFIRPVPRPRSGEPAGEAPSEVL